MSRIDTVSTGGADDCPAAPMFSYSGAARTPLLLSIALIGNPALLLVFSGVNVLSVLMPEAMTGWERSQSFWFLFVMARGNSATFIICAALAVYSVLTMLFGAWFARRLARSRSPLAVTAEGICAYRGAKPWGSIAWDEVVWIARCETRGKYGRTFTTVLIKGPRFTLKMSETIDGYADAKRLLTRYAHQHGVKLRAAAKGLADDEITEL